MSDEAHPNYRFYVTINDKAKAVFTEISGLQVETVVQDYEEGGNNEFIHRLPGRTKVGNVTLKYGLTKSNELFKWYADIVRGKITRYNLSVIMYDTEGNELVRWNFLNAFPVKWTGPQFSADGRAMAIETLELAHEGMQLGK
jgi:phage tail-like protein